MFDTKGKSRTGFLQRLFSKEEAQQLDDAMQKVEQVVELAGVQRKEVDLEKTKGFLENLTADFMKPISKLTDDESVRAELANEIAALAIGRLLNLSEEMPTEEEPTEEMAEDEEEEEPLPEELMELGKQVADLANEATEIHKELKSFVPAIVSMATTIKQLAPLVEKSNVVETLEARVKELEDFISLTPRQASKSVESVVVHEGLQKIVKKGTEDGNPQVWGHEVKELN